MLYRDVEAETEATLRSLEANGTPIHLSEREIRQFIHRIWRERHVRQYSVGE